MTPAETTELLAFVREICPAESEREMRTEAWYPGLADLPANDVLTAMIQLARRGGITPRGVRAEVLARRGNRAVRGCRPWQAPALRVGCPWCGAAPGEPCTVPGSDTRLRKATAHPLRVTIAEGANGDR